MHHIQRGLSRNRACRKSRLCGSFINMSCPRLFLPQTDINFHPPPCKASKSFAENIFVRNSPHVPKLLSYVRSFTTKSSVSDMSSAHLLRNQIHIQPGVYVCTFPRAYSPMYTPLQEICSLHFRRRGFQSKPVFFLSDGNLF